MMNAIVPLDLTYFLLAREQIADLSPLSTVESAWHSSKGTVRMFGWVVALETEKRFYLELELTDVEGQRHQLSDLEITPLATHQRYPDELETAVDWYRPDHINRHLGLAERALH